MQTVTLQSTGAKNIRVNLLHGLKATHWTLFKGDHSPIKSRNRLSLGKAQSGNDNMNCEKQLHSRVTVLPAPQPEIGMDGKHEEERGNQKSLNNNKAEPESSQKPVCPGGA